MSLKRVRDTYAKLLRSFRRYRDDIMLDAPCAWAELRHAYTDEDFDKAYWTSEQAELIQPEIRAVFLALLISGKITDDEFTNLAKKFLKVKKSLEIALFNSFVNDEGLAGEMLKLHQDGSIQIEPIAVSDLS